MENKKDENIEIIEASAEVTDAKEKASFKEGLSKAGSFFKKIAKIFKSDKIKNENLFKKGGYSLAITALVLVALIVFNWLVSSLADRFNLKLDLTSDKKNSISQENIEHIKNLDADITVTVCAAEDDYASLMPYYAQQLYGVTIATDAEAQYFDQTVKLISKYADYNKRITVKYVDPQSTEFSALTSNYSELKFNYGDILITSKISGKERKKLLGFDDIYALTADQSSYYQTAYNVSANRLEASLTSAIIYVTNTDSKKVAVITGHSSNDYSDAYKILLDELNYEYTEITDKMITKISDEFDAVVISSPTIDFVGSEIDVISAFLDNNGKLGKGLLFFADATCPSLPNFNSFLTQWGITIGNGVLFETDDGNHSPDSPSTMGVVPVELEDDDIIASSDPIAIVNYLVPMNVSKPASTDRTSKALMQTLDSVVVAPVGSSSDWAEYTDADKKQFDCVIQAQESKFDADNNELTSYVMAFSSVEFIQSQWAEEESLSNKKIVWSCTDRAAHVDDASVLIPAKVITSQNFASKVTESSTKLISVIFMFIVPVAVIVLGIAVFVRRRNAQ